MRLSEAIRAGAGVIKQKYAAGFPEGKEGCAIQAAAVGVREFSNNPNFDDARNINSDLGRAFNMNIRVWNCPSGQLCEEYRGFRPYLTELCGMIMHLNDDHHMSFSEIADYVQIQEAIAGIGQDQNEPVIPTPELVNAS